MSYMIQIIYGLNNTKMPQRPR